MLDRSIFRKGLHMKTSARNNERRRVVYTNGSWTVDEHFGPAVGVVGG